MNLPIVNAWLIDYPCRSFTEQVREFEGSPITLRTLAAVDAKILEIEQYHKSIGQVTVDSIHAYALLHEYRAQCTYIID